MLLRSDVHGQLFACHLGDMQITCQVSAFLQFWLYLVVCSSFNSQHSPKARVATRPYQ